MNSVNSYISYFRTLQDLHPAINSFYMMDINEPLIAFHADMKFPMLVLHAVTGTLLANNRDNILDGIQGGFMLLDFLDDPTDFTTEMDILDRMKTIGLDIILKMEHDAINRLSMTNTWLNGFNLNSVSYQMIDGIWDKCFGFIFNFKIETALSQSYNPDCWSFPKIRPEPQM